MQDILEGCKGYWLFGCHSSVIQAFPTSSFDCLRQGRLNSWQSTDCSSQVSCSWVCDCMHASLSLDFLNLYLPKSICMRLYTCSNVTTRYIPCCIILLLQNARHNYKCHTHAWKQLQLASVHVYSIMLLLQCMISLIPMHASLPPFLFFCLHSVWCVFLHHIFRIVYYIIWMETEKQDWGHDKAIVYVYSPGI